MSDPKELGWCVTCGEQACHCAERGFDAEWMNAEAYVDYLKSQLEQARAELEETRNWIATTAENHIDLCRQLGTHLPIEGNGCFGVAECVNCFRIGFAIQKRVEQTNKQLEARVKELEESFDFAIKEITAGMAMRPDLEWDRGDNWNSASKRAIEIIKENKVGKGFFHALKPPPQGKGE